MSQKRVLIITYYWPPSGGVGVQRWLHFARNLKELGWDPIVYTPENPQFDVKDESLESLAEGIEVIKRPIWEPFTFFHRLTGGKNKDDVKQGLVMEKSKKSWKDQLFVWIRGNLFVPDPRVFWVRPSVRYLKKVITEKEIATIITTGPPHSMHLIGLGLKMQNPRLKWIADFRDPWSDWDLLDKLKTTSIAKKWHAKAEKQVVEKADRLLVTSKGTALLFEEKYQEVAAAVITNGINAVIHDDIVKNDLSKFTIGYFGMLNEIRNPESFWNALEALCQANESFRNCLELRLGGIVGQSIVSQLDGYGFSDKIVYLGYLPHSEVFAEYAKCDLLLLLQNKSLNSRYLIPAKFFEYLTAKKPILGLGVRPSDLENLFRSRNIGEFFDYQDQDEVEKFISSVFEKRYKVDDLEFESMLKVHSREQKAMELIRLLEEV